MTFSGGSLFPNFSILRTMYTTRCGPAWGRTRADQRRHVDILCLEGRRRWLVECPSVPRVSAPDRDSGDPLDEAVSRRSHLPPRRRSRGGSSPMNDPTPCRSTGRGLRRRQPPTPTPPVARSLLSPPPDPTTPRRLRGLPDHAPVLDQLVLQLPVYRRESSLPAPLPLMTSTPSSLPSSPHLTM